jgi:Na+/melibiose symporter-like transporter
MSGGRTIANIVAGILIIFGVLMVIGATDQDQGDPAWIIPGIIIIVVGLVVIYFSSRAAKKEAEEAQTTLKIDLPADVNIERFQCQDCGAQLTMDNVKMVAGAPMVNCPYCDAAYQLSEEPKW